MVEKEHCRQGVNIENSSEGTLGFIAEITFRTVVEPLYKSTSLMLFPDIGTACLAVMKLDREVVSAAELMDRIALRSIPSGGVHLRVFQQPSLRDRAFPPQRDQLPVDRLPGGPLHGAEAGNGIARNAAGIDKLGVGKGRVIVGGRKSGNEKSRLNSRLFLSGAEDETRTRMGCCPPPPQDGVSTNSTTSARRFFLSLRLLYVNSKVGAVLLFGCLRCLGCGLGCSWCRRLSLDGLRGRVGLLGRCHLGCCLG